MTLRTDVEDILGAGTLTELMLMASRGMSTLTGDKLLAWAYEQRLDDIGLKSELQRAKLESGAALAQVEGLRAANEQLTIALQKAEQDRDLAVERALTHRF